MKRIYNKFKGYPLEDCDICGEKLNEVAHTFEWLPEEESVQ